MSAGRINAAPDRPTALTGFASVVEIVFEDSIPKTALGSRTLLVLEHFSAKWPRFAVKKVRQTRKEEMIPRKWKQLKASADGSKGRQLT